MWNDRARRIARASGLIAALVCASTNSQAQTAEPADLAEPSRGWPLPAIDLPVELTGFLALDSRVFFRSPQSPQQRRLPDALGFVAEPEWYYPWNDGDDAVLFVPFLRVNAFDSDRTHFDFRELNYLHVGNDWELRIGFAKVFWGVIETQHLVDIINQDDGLEDIDGEDKLGEPMIHLTLIRDHGVFETFVMPGFRERRFPGKHGRLRAPVIVKDDDPQYDSPLGQGHIDVAGRWSHTIGQWDVALSNFYGTGRDPRLLPSLGGQGEPRLIPRYDLINQTGLEVQYTGETILLKLEAIGRSGQGSYRPAFAAGFEYIFVGVFGTDADLGFLVEFHFDHATFDQPFSPLDRDVFGGFRLTLNDEQGTELLAGAIVDTRDGSQFWNIEASRRLLSHWRIELDARFFNDIPSSDSFHAFARDDFVQLRLAWYF